MCHVLSLSPLDCLCYTSTSFPRFLNSHSLHICSIKKGLTGMQQPPEGNYQNPPTQPPYAQRPTQSPYNPQQTPLPPPPYQYGTYPPSQPPMMPRKPKRWPWIVAIIVAFVFGDMAGHGHTTTTDTTAAAPVSQNSSISQTQPTEAPTQPQKPLAWTTIQTFSGNGNQKTAVFAANDNWKIVWSCTPDTEANTIGGYSFYVSVDNSDTSLADWNALSGSCKPGSVTASTNEHVAGNVFLDISSSGGPWTITIQEMK